MASKIATSKMCDYELYRLASDYLMEEEDVAKIRNLSDRYHIVDYNGKTIATAKTMDKAIQNANKVKNWGIDAIIDEKMLVAWEFNFSRLGAGHTFIKSATRRY